MCETTLYLEQHPKVMAELVEAVRSLQEMAREARALRDDARALRLSLTPDTEADVGSSERHD